MTPHRASHWALLCVILHAISGGVQATSFLRPGWASDWQDAGIADGMVDDRRPHHRRRFRRDGDILFPGDYEEQQHQQPHETNPYDDALYGEQEKECLNKRTFHYKGTCYKLKTDQACNGGEWLVLDKFDAGGELLKPVCKAKPCTGRDEVWWPETSGCETRSSLRSGSCKGENKEVVIDSYGDGVCQCQKEYGEREDDDKCYKYFQQGPCAPDQVFVYDPSTGFGICSADLCFQLNKESSGTKKQPYKSRSSSGRRLDPSAVSIRRKRARTVSQKEKLFAPLEGTGQCYKLSTVGPCGQVHNQSRYVIDEHDHVPRCSTPGNELNIIDAPVLCRVGDNNLCRDPIQIKQEDRLSYLNNLKNQLKKKAG